MRTRHSIHYKDARKLSEVPDQTAHLVVTSPPYPMISMWDEAFFSMNPEISSCLSDGDGMAAFRLMHLELAKVWREVFRVLVPGGIACINVGDATRTIRKDFRLYPNHVQILSDCCEAGFEALPEIIWRKPANSPTKFLGSGMLPCGAYVTLEHEVILILRKSPRRAFDNGDDKLRRRESSFFWEERNQWFSDMWYLNGKRQALNSKGIRRRSGAYPIEIPMRLITMHSSKFDTVLDPFAGTGTTTLAAITCCRHSIGYEVDCGFRDFHKSELSSSDTIDIANGLIRSRLHSHAEFIRQCRSENRRLKYRNANGFAVVTRQEVEMTFETVKQISQGPDVEGVYTVDYEPIEPGSGLLTLFDEAGS